MSVLRVGALVVGGAVVAVVGTFVPLVRWISPFLGGALAGYVHDRGPWDGAKLGGAVAALAVVAFVAFGLVAAAVLALVGSAVEDPEAAAQLTLYGGLVALLWVVLVPLWTLVSAPLGGVVGGKLAEERRGDDVGEGGGVGGGEGGGVEDSDRGRQGVEWPGDDAG